MDYAGIVGQLISRIPELVAFLVAFKWVLDASRKQQDDNKELQRLLISNGLTKAIEKQGAATEKLNDKIELLPDRVGVAVALKMLDMHKQ